MSTRTHRSAAGSAPSTASLVRAAGDGEEHAWSALVERFSPALRRVAADHRLQSHDVEDVTQACWLALVESVHAVREPDAVGAWLVTAARRQALRTRTRLARDTPVEPAAQDERPGGDCPETAVIDLERARALRVALRRLPPHQRALLEAMTAQPEPSYAEVARRLEMPIGSVGPTRARGLERLRDDRHLRAAVAA